MTGDRAMTADLSRTDLAALSPPIRTDHRLPATLRFAQRSQPASATSRRRRRRNRLETIVHTMEEDRVEVVLVASVVVEVGASSRRRTPPRERSFLSKWTASQRSGCTRAMALPSFATLMS